MSGGGDYRTPSSEGDAALTVWDVGTALGPAGDNEGYLRVMLSAGATPRQVNTLVGWRWTSPALLREAAALLEAAADWLDTPAPVDDGQLSLDDFREEATHG